MKKEIVKTTFSISNVMCHEGCGTSIRNLLSDLNTFKQRQWLPASAETVICPRPSEFGTYCFEVKIESEEEFNLDNAHAHEMLKDFEERLTNAGFPLVSPTWANWINIAVNLGAITAIIILNVVFPPSLLLTLGLTAISFLSTAFTARSYFKQFYYHLREKELNYMPTAITSGWLLSLAHTIYHVIKMPVSTGFSMAFMNFVMPATLVTLVNVMDEIKRLILAKSRSMYRSLFPQMAKEYDCYQLSSEDQDLLKIMDADIQSEDNLSHLQKLMETERQILSLEESALKKGMLITVKPGACFPVDCKLLQGGIWVDESHLTGEPRHAKERFDFVHAGAVNLSQTVKAWVANDSYDSTINKILFRANRERKAPPVSHRKFTYLYTALILISIMVSIAIPVALGFFTLPLLLQNTMGILFAVCPCTVAIGHQLPRLLSLYQRNKKGIKCCNEALASQSDSIHTIVFDKTGTLTTGNSQVDSSEGIEDPLWQRIYLLEKAYGAEHPLARAINTYYETTYALQSIVIRDISDESIDKKNRGLSAIVQGNIIHVGNIDYLQDEDIAYLPKEFSRSVQEKLSQGYSPVYVAENKIYKGVILIKHEVREGIIPLLNRLKNPKDPEKKITLIMLTGDEPLSAEGFNKQNGLIFEPENIHAKQTPQKKEAFLRDLMASVKSKNKKESKGKEKSKDIAAGVWFVGDGLNDALCARVVSEEGGVSCSMTSTDKVAFFSDIMLNGSINYLFDHTTLNQFVKKNIAQNQWILAYGAIAFLAFILGFSVAGVAVSPLIPLVVMTSTTLFILFNSYRAKCAVDNILDEKASWLKKPLASDLSLGLLISTSVLLIGALLITTIATGGLAFPVIAFTAGIVTALGSACILAAGVTVGSFALCVISYFLGAMFNTTDRQTKIAQVSARQPVEVITDLPSKFVEEEKNQGINNLFHPRNKKENGFTSPDILEENVAQNYTHVTLS
ncbi:HAD-IC family P-type ATPase [Legionella fairfieldensis]|uniref:HAD-IC family P-type ATPase n=1 Tax=Legionella fairfieldensis TaxID=45064 RepID=UPI0006848E7F|nr:HAD-IC family P-type ATPase [Legionella fairfieldensis]